MWELLQTLVYIVLFLMLLTTFMSPEQRRRARAALAALWHAVEPYAYRLVTGMGAPADAPQHRPPARHAPPLAPAGAQDRALLGDLLDPRTEPFAGGRGETARSDANEPVRSVRERGDSLVLTRDEIAAVARMIAHNKSAAKPTKSSTIQAGFGVSRGGGATYLRASAIYDQIFAAPNEAMYPTLTAEREKISAP